MAILGIAATDVDGYAPDKESTSSQEEGPSFEILKPNFEVAATQFFHELQDGISNELAMKISSLGFLSSTDASCALLHESTTSPAYIRFSADERLIKGRNMDSGCCVRRFEDKTNAACIADGISGDGLASVFAAHLFCSLLIYEIAKKPIRFIVDREVNTKTTANLFKKIAKKASTFIPCGTYKIHAGAPIGFVDCSPLSDPNRYGAAVGALGDVIIYHYSTRDKRISQINTITRNLGADQKPLMSDTGGSISTEGILYCPERLSTNYIEIASDDFMILGTDGLHDNLLFEEAEKIVAFIIQNDFFDQSLEQLVSYPRPWEIKNPPSLPTVAELADFVGLHSVQADQKPLTASRITTRIVKYLKLVNQTSFAFDEEYYDLHLQHKQVLSENEQERSALTSKIIQLNNKCPKAPGKPDDCMVITIQPSNNEWA
jgi:serine/threonine protein phosphatase PrpC